MSTNYSERKKWLRRAGLIVGLVTAGITSVLIIGSIFIANAVSTSESLPSYVWIVTAIPALLLFGVVAVAWKWNLTGGILLVVVGIWPLVSTLLTLPGLLEELNQMPEIAASTVDIEIMRPFIIIGGVIMTIPPVASGVLFILAWISGRKEHRSPTPPPPASA
jgi:hypothetical protein